MNTVPGAVRWGGVRYGAVRCGASHPPSPNLLSARLAHTIPGPRCTRLSTHSQPCSVHATDRKTSEAGKGEEEEQQPEVVEMEEEKENERRRRGREGEQRR
ncbi:hypothetical protein E2C01_034817 [Portunus trituberculatus]|uniref:Uncharacterized protein n=1 Tax=Portunus trituberculatus TaxID=210409 RepID=A0A5B7F1J6_PORTR|nr:hypothetical protein [Portunus trituberculatus]